MCAVKPPLIESCGISFLSQNMYERIPLLRHHWLFTVASPGVSHTTLLPVTILYVLLLPLLLPGHPEQQWVI